MLEIELLAWSSVIVEELADEIFNFVIGRDSGHVILLANGLNPMLSGLINFFSSFHPVSQ
jgi:hypothetical protein